jgi:transcriptional regulator with XRE-family HTH domain
MELKTLLARHFSETKETVRAFSGRSGVSVATIFRVKNGEYGDYKRMKRIVDALGKPIDIFPSSAPPPEAPE